MKKRNHIPLGGKFTVYRCMLLWGTSTNQDCLFYQQVGKSLTFVATYFNLRSYVCQMKITDLSGLWFDTKDLSIISLPFISYSITRESFASKGMKGEIFRISYKSPILVPFSGSLTHPTMEIAKRKVHEHLEGLIQHFLKPLEGNLVC